MLPLEKMTKNDEARVLDVYMYNSGHMGLERNMGHGPSIDCSTLCIVVANSFMCAVLPILSTSSLGMVWAQF